MKIANATVVVLLSTFATTASALHLKAKKKEDATVDHSVTQRNLAPGASRSLWTPAHYKQTCGCVSDYIKELTTAQFEILSSISPLLYGTFSGVGYEITGYIKDVAAEATSYLLQYYQCGCENVDDYYYGDGSFDKKDRAYGYHDCCCNAEITKDIFIAQMQAIADIPTGYYDRGDGSLYQLIYIIKEADNQVLQQLNMYIPELYHYYYYSGELGAGENTTAEEETAP